MNLIPLPPLDGGHVLMLVIEKVRGRPVDYRRLVPVSATVIVLLSAFALATMVLDVTKPIPRSRELTRRHDFSIRPARPAGTRSIR